MNKNAFAKPSGGICGTWTFATAGEIAEWCARWLPIPVSYLLALPFAFWMICVAMVEYGLRYILTPAHIWNDQP